MPETPDLIPTSEVAATLRQSVRNVHRLINAGELVPALKVPGATGAYLFNRADIERYRDEHTEPAQAAS